jgi:tetratricopeptide (TPR) repeat protein
MRAGVGLIRMVGILCVLTPTALAQPSEPCTTSPAASQSDPALALQYLAVGIAELEAGDERTAARAFARALELDASLSEARDRLARLCASVAHPRAPSAEIALARAAEHYRLGQDEQAKAALELPLAAPELRGPANLYRALIALRVGELGQARRALTEAEGDPKVARGVAVLRRLVARRGRMIASLGVAGGYDSNVQLLPEQPPTGATRTPAGDGRYTLTSGLAVQPLERLDLRIEQVLIWQDQFEVDAFDLFASSTLLKWGAPPRWLVRP